VSNDGDVTTTAWRVTGNMRDAAEVIGRLEIDDKWTPGLMMARFDGSRVWIEYAPEGFGRDVLNEGGEIIETIYDASDIRARFPDVVAWG
jgi:hypothetical protein